jgi:hypothetical protein
MRLKDCLNLPDRQDRHFHQAFRIILYLYKAKKQAFGSKTPFIFDGIHTNCRLAIRITAPVLYTKQNQGAFLSFTNIFTCLLAGFHFICPGSLAINQEVRKWTLIPCKNASLLRGWFISSEGE